MIVKECRVQMCTLVFLTLFSCVACLMWQYQTGKVESCIPGNWYVISNALKDDDLDVNMVVHSKNLKLLRMNSREQQHGEGTQEQSDDFELPIS